MSINLEDRFMSDRTNGNQMLMEETNSFSLPQMS